MMAPKVFTGLGISRCMVAGVLVCALTSRASMADDIDDILDGEAGEEDKGEAASTEVSDKRMAPQSIIDNGFYVSSAVVYKMPFGTMQGFLNPAIAYRGGAQTIRTDTHRLIAHRGGELELYDHTTPEGETKNLAADQPDKAAALLKQLQARLAK